MDMQYLSLIIGAAFIGVGWALGRLAKVFTRLADNENESKTLYAVWKICWFLAIVSMLATFIVAFVQFMPYIQKAIDWVVSMVLI